MPSYLFQHPETEETVEVIQSIKDVHEHIDEHGVSWNRLWTVPNASVDSLNDGTKEGFMKHTQNKRGTMGELWEASKESSEKRIQKYGEDRIKEDSLKKYSEKRNGMRHQDSRPSKDSTLEI